ncbi:hypothetical protein KKA02_02485 [Patescibacteria group bacterium]|nr:hypothetical protein [Patescibacteria group bacterium]
MQQAIVSVSSRGLVYLPRKFQSILGLQLQTPGKIMIKLDEDNDKKVFLKPVRPLSAFDGVLKGKKKKVWKNFRDLMEKEYKRV